MQNITVSSGLSLFIEYGRVKYATRTIQTYRGLIQRFITYIGDVSLKELDIDHVTKYYTHLERKNYAESSVAFAIIAIRQFCKYLYFRGLIGWDYNLIPIPKYTSNSYRPISTKEAENMIDRAEGDSIIKMRDRAILSFLYASGMRVSEICELRLSNLYMDEQYGSIISKKNRLRRMIFWDNKTHEHLNTYLEERQHHATSDYLFISLSRVNKGSQLSTRSVQRIVAQYRGESWMSAHGFRHGLGMRAVQSGIHPRYTQKILGHKNMNSQQVYLDVHDREVVTAYKRLTKGFK